MIHIKNTNIKQNENTVVTIGNFDSFHLGHLELIKCVKEFKNKFNLKSVIFSFYPYPKNILYNKNIDSIFTNQEKIILLNNIDIDIFIQYPFNKQFSLLNPEEFVKDILVNKLRCKVLIVGQDYKFGKNCTGNVDFLKDICKKMNINLVIVKHILYKNEKISSSNIRNLILRGNFIEANKILYNTYFIYGIVVEGNKLGRIIGFPTVNLMVPSNKIIPVNGVYVTKTFIKSKNILYNSITNIGTRPTINDNMEKTIESFIFNFNEYIYGFEIIIYFYKLLRYEKKFDSLKSLKNQIDIDIRNTELFFKENLIL